MLYRTFAFFTIPINSSRSEMRGLKILIRAGSRIPSGGMRAEISSKVGGCRRTWGAVAVVVFVVVFVPVAVCGRKGFLLAFVVAYMLNFDM